MTDKNPNFADGLETVDNAPDTEVENQNAENSIYDSAEHETKERILSPDDIFSEDECKDEAKDETESDADAVINEDAAGESFTEIYVEYEAEGQDESQNDAPDGAQYTLIHMPTRSTASDTADTAEEKSGIRAYNPEKPRLIDKAFEFVELFVFTLVAVMLISSFFFRHSVVDGPSMDNTLHNGEHLIITNLFYTPKQGDIIVCDDHTTALKKPIVKRVIATEGQRVTITADGTVKVDGIPLPEEYVHLTNKNYVYEPYDDVVPEGKIFVMGDHRDNSSDSREPLVGPIDVRSVLGKVILRIYPFDRFGTVN